MIEKITRFFIENSKLTLVLIISVFLLWIFSYLSIPKQYNPEIVVPAFEVWINAPGLNSNEVNKYIISPLEDKIMELEEIDDVYWFSRENFWWVMLKFKVWTDKEKAKIRLNQKLSENLDLKPIWVWNPIIKTIDPDELAQITYAISLKENWETEDDLVYLKMIANQIKEEIRKTKDVTTIDIVWWYNRDLIIEVDFKKLESLNLDINSIVNLLKTNNKDISIWDLDLSNQENLQIQISSSLEDLEKYKKLIVLNKDEKIVYLEDVANIKYWINKIKKLSYFNDKNAVFIWFWKKIWTNSVTVTSQIKQEIEEIKKNLPKNISVDIIQDEWQTAKKATDMLIINLIQSILIVLIVLTLSLWIRNALNTAISIPLTLFSIFIISFIIWENINRITLFALILVLWMLVDDSTVVVENINNHLLKRKETWKTKLEAILDAISEVKLWVILSTLTRLFAFWAMFFVTWMMWEYMWPIPQFALMASIISTMVALTINPWFSYFFTKDKQLKENKKASKLKRPSIRKLYLKFMSLFLWEEKNKQKRRKIFRTIFWILLIFVIIAPIYLWIFKARMLPKSDQNQIYIWIDGTRSWSSDKMNDLQLDLNKYVKENESNMIKSVSLTIWQSFMWDFANLFRWWNQRNWENQLSARINLYSKEEYKLKNNSARISSEEYTIELRQRIREYLLEKYPDIKIKLLEDPPWPPVISTFSAKIKSDAWEENLLNFSREVEKNIRLIWSNLWLVDIYNNVSTTKRELNYIVDYDTMIKSNLSTDSINNIINILTNWLTIWVIKDKDSIDPSNLVLKSDVVSESSYDLLNTLKITNNLWENIDLSSIVTKQYSFVDKDIETDNKEKSYTISAELWNNSLVYPQIKLFKYFLSDEFLDNKYKIKSWNPYKIEYIWLQDWKNYKIEWWWEWELTMDTFRDLWIAMIVALIWIYLLLVGQFKNFRIALIIMISFLLWFFWVFPGFTILYLLNWEYFSATSMIWIIALAWIVVWNAIILIEYINIMKQNWLLLKDALLKAWYTRFKPIILTSLTTVFWAMTIIWDPVWSWLAWSIISWLLLSALLTLIVIPIFYYDSQKRYWK